MWVLGTRPRFSVEQQVLWTVEPSLQSRTPNSLAILKYAMYYYLSYREIPKAYSSCLPDILRPFVSVSSLHLPSPPLLATIIYSLLL